MPVRGRSSTRRLAVLLAVLVLLLPVLVVRLIPTDTHEPFVFRAMLTEHLAQSDSGKLQYFRANVVDGNAPASSIVVALDRAYTRGYQPALTSASTAAWFQGSLMTPDIFYGEQYLFFGLPQVYTRQVKTGLLWPDQWTELRVLYLSPVATLAAPIQIPFLIRSDSFTYTILAVLVARSILVGLAVYAVIRSRRSPRRGTTLALLELYALFAMLITIPILGDLF